KQAAHQDAQTFSIKLEPPKLFVSNVVPEDLNSLSCRTGKGSPTNGDGISRGSFVNPMAKNIINIINIENGISWRTTTTLKFRL
ncbi:MAG: hypothetical protein ACJ0Q9_04545, partial [Gammaproteobacteria bacterium]